MPAPARLRSRTLATTGTVTFVQRFDSALRPKSAQPESLGESTSSWTPIAASLLAKQRVITRTNMRTELDALERYMEGKKTS